MALIEIYTVVADQYPVDPDWAGTPELLEGLFVRLDADGYATTIDTPASQNAFGVAGDTQSNSTAGTPYSASLIINSAGATRQTQNRVSDFYNETLASGKVTVYHSGGKFATDQFESNVTAAAPGAKLYVSANSKLTTSAVGDAVALFVSHGAEQSGVPGTVVNGSTSLGNYVTFKLLA